jgi:carbon storage regulator
MRLLTRRIGQSLIVGDGVTITVKSVRGDRVRLSVDAPQGVRIARQEIIEELDAAAKRALGSVGSQDVQVFTEEGLSSTGRLPLEH